jgi:hypothetical protein
MRASNGGRNADPALMMRPLLAENAITALVALSLLPFVAACADFLVELRGFEPMVITGTGRSRATPLFASQRALLARDARLRDRDHAFALVAVFLAPFASRHDRAAQKSDETLQPAYAFKRSPAGS